MIIQTDTFKLLIEKVHNYKGYTLLEILQDDGMCNIIHYDTKEEFEKDFSFAPHGFFPHEKRLFPKNVVESYGRESVTCIIQGETYYLRLMELYLVIDGKHYDTLEELKNRKDVKEN